MIIKNEKGEDIEVFTQEEVSERVKTAETQAATKAVDDFKAANPDKTGELTEAQTKLAEAERLLREAENDPAKKAQIERLRQERDDAKAVAETVKSDFDKKFDAFKSEIIGDVKTELLDRASNGDAELRRKIEVEFDNYRPGATSKKDIQERMEKAYQLATGNKPTPNFLDGRTGGGDRGHGDHHQSQSVVKEPTPNAKAIGSVLGITEADRKAHEEKYLPYKKEKQALGLIPPDGVSSN